MMDRYEDDVQEITLKERSGWKFILSAREIYLQLARMQKSGSINLDQQFQKIVPAIDELTQLWENEEKGREKFIVPNTLKEDYHFAKKRYARMKGYPEDFHKEDTNKRAELEKEKIALANRIKTYEVEFAREEDEVRREVNNERIKLTSELAVLKYKKQKYEEKAEGVAKCFLMCNKKDVNRLAETNEKIKQIEDALRKIGPIQSKSLAEKRYQMELLHKRRWDVDKALNAHDGSAGTRLRRWTNAVDNAEVVMIVRRMDIDDAVNRYYSTVSSQVIHAMLNVYALLKMCAAQISAHEHNIEDDISQLTEFADIIHCTDIANRSVVTLYKKMQILKEEDRNQIINHKPAKSGLPEALVKTFSVKNFRNTAGTLGLFRRVDTSKPVESAEPAAPPALVSAMKK